MRARDARTAEPDAQQVVVFLPADDATSHAIERLRGRPYGTLRAVT